MFGENYSSTNSSSYKPKVVISKVISASEVLDKIKLGQPVEYYQVIIKGDLNLSQLDLPTTQLERRDSHYWPLSYYGPSDNNGSLVSSPLYIEDSIIEGNVDLGHTTFRRLVDFRGTSFNGTADFSNSNFKETADFSRTKFNGNASFQFSMFKEDVDFRESFFNRTANFCGSEFDGDAYFWVSTFMGKANFEETLFNGKADFPNSKFKNTVYFGHRNFFSIFPTTPYIYGTARFPGSHFYGDAHFSNMQFIGNADFSSSCFEQTADFSESQFNKNTDFNGSNFREYIQFEGSEFLGFLNLTKIKFNHIDIDWTHVNNLICEDGPTYLALIRNCRNMEQYVAADDIYYQYRQWRQDQSSCFEAAKYFDILALISCGYGIKVQRPIGCAIIVLFLFGLIYLLGYIRGSSRNEGFKLKSKESLAFSAVALFSLPRELYPYGDDIYLKFIKQSINITLIRRKIRVSYRFLVFLERLIGWSLLILFINTLSRVMIRY